MNALSRRIFMQAAGAWTMAPAIGRSSVRRPNIVYILADDLGWGDLACYNPESRIPTPNSDRMAREGMRFTDMHSPSAVCTPTRYGVLTGRYCWRSSLKKGVLWGESPNLIEPGRMTVPSFLRSQGYFTAGVGKWHLGLGGGEKTDYTRPLRPGPLDHGFDYYFGIPASLDMAPYLYFENDRVVAQPTSRTGGCEKPRGVFWREGAAVPDFRVEDVQPALTDRAVRIVRERAGTKQPFFLYFAMTSPHTPWVPVKKFQGKSGAGLYGDFVAQVDDTVGQVLAALRESGADKDTLVIFTSDNGADWKPEDKKAFPHRANGPWRGGKADIWDAGHRIPFLARWPGAMEGGRNCDHLCCLTDLLSTVAAITGGRLPDDAGEDSFDLSGTLRGRTSAAPRSSIVHHSLHGMFSIRNKHWKLCLGLGSGGFTAPVIARAKAGEAEGQLYDLVNDPLETENLYAKRPDVVASLRRELDAVEKEGRSRPNRT